MPEAKSLQHNQVPIGTICYVNTRQMVNRIITAIKAE